MLTAGSRLGPYEIVAPIGAGGMGEVYRARDTRLGRDVAIKVLPADLATDAERLKRFEREAKATAALSHPNILAVHDIGTHGGVPYLVEELLEGEALGERIERGAIPVGEAVGIAVQIVSGLTAAHAKGIVHRDLKPGNVFITNEGLVKILDFGLAKLVENVPPGETDTLTHAPTDATRFGRVLGTMAYMAPEQARGMPVDQRADIFAFGVVLYEMLSGERPFRGETATDTVAAILMQEPAPLPEGVPPALQGVVSQCLAKRPEQRFSSAHDLALALRATSSGPQTPATATVKVSVRVLRIRRPWLAGAAGVGFIAVAVALYLWKPWRNAAPAATFDPKSVVVAAFENRTSDASLDNVGTQIADTLTSDLLKTGELKVAVNPVAADRHGAGGSGQGGDPLLRLGQATRSALVVAGTYDLRGDQLEVQARVVDPWQGNVLYTAAPVRCPRADPVAALEPLRQYVTGAVVWRSDRNQRATWNGFHPPRYDALAEFRLGQATNDDASQVAHWEKAASLDPEFCMPQLSRVYALFFSDRFEETAKELAPLEANVGRMMSGEQLSVRLCRALLDGRRLDTLATLHEMAALSGFPEEFDLDIGAQEMMLNRPAEAIRDLSISQAVAEAEQNSVNTFPAGLLAQAYHMNRDYEGQLKLAREAQRRFPGRLLFYSFEAQALAALGRLDEVEKVIQACEAMPAQGGSPAHVMITVGAELRAHGHREAALKMAERGAAWFQTHPDTANCQRCLLWALPQTERWADVKATADALLAKNPDDIGIRGAVGKVAARLGDVAQARRIEAELAALTKPYLYGTRTYQRACIAALLGEKDRAMELLRDAFAKGYQFDVGIHRDIDLEPLWGYPPFEDLMKPKG